MLQRVLVCCGRMIAPAIDLLYAIDEEAHPVVGDDIEAVGSRFERNLCSPAGRKAVCVDGLCLGRPGAPVVVNGGLLPGEDRSTGQRAVVPVQRLPDDNGR